MRDWKDVESLYLRRKARQDRFVLVGVVGLFALAWALGLL